MNIILSLSITLAIETGIYMILKHRDIKLFIVVSIMNIVLNLGMNIALSYVNDQTLYWIILISAEIGTTLIESLIVFLFMKFKFLKVLLFAFIANFASFTIGYLLNLTPIYQTKIALVIVTALFLSVYLFSYVFVFTVTVFNYRNRNNDSRRND